MSNLRKRPTAKWPFARRRRGR